MSKNSIAKNTVYFTAASVGQKLISFLYFTLIANVIGVENTGAYFLAVSIVVMFSIVADWGLTPVLIREIAQKPSTALASLRSILGLKIPLIILGIVSSLVATWVLGYDQTVTLLVLVGGLVMLGDSIGLTFYGVLRGLQNLKYESIGMFAGQLIIAMVGGVSLLIHPQLEFLVLALGAGSLWNMMFSGFHVRKRLGKKALVPTFTKTEAKKFLKISFAFALAGVFVRVYSYSDTIILSKLMDEEAVGIYSIAYKITYAFQFLPLAFVGALYPAMSDLFTTDRKRLTSLFDEAMKYMLVLSVPVMFGIATTADVIIPLVYPEFTASILPLQVLIFVLLFQFLDFPVGSLLNAGHKQATQTTLMGITMVLSIIANIVLIPLLGVLGASVAAIISLAFLFVGGMVFVPSLLANYRIVPLVTWAGLVLLSGALMGVVVLFTKPALPIYVVILLGVLVYTTCLFLFKVIEPEQIRKLRQRMRPSTYEPSPDSHT